MTIVMFVDPRFLMHLHLSGVEEESAAFCALVRLTCSKRTIRLSKDAKRKSWSASVADCGNGFFFIEEVSVASLECSNCSYIRLHRVLRNRDPAIFLS